MQLKSYWTACFIFDLAKMYVTIIIGMILFAAFELELDDMMSTFVLLPWGALPFVYVT